MRNMEFELPETRWIYIWLYRTFYWSYLVVVAISSFLYFSWGPSAIPHVDEEQPQKKVLPFASMNPGLRVVQHTSELTVMLSTRSIKAHSPKTSVRLSAITVTTVEIITVTKPFYL